MSDNVIRLPRGQLTVHEFIAEVVAEVEEFKATRALVVLFNKKDERAIMRHQMTVADGALVAMDCIKMVNADDDDDP